MIGNEDIRRAQQANLDQVEQLREKELERYREKHHEFSLALQEATKTLKAFESG
ncbi:hypothetical protein ABBQ32_004012 [Trebouxia sp. C0010 RCD-2024]